MKAFCIKNNKKFHDFSIASIFFIISLILRICNYTEQPIFADEIKYFSAYSFSILSHNWSWPLRWMWIQPPLFPYILAFVTYIFNGELYVLRLVPIFFGSLSVYVLYFLGKILFDRRVGILSAILLIFSSYHIFYSRVLMLEAQLILFMLISSYFFFKSYKKKDDFKYACASGIFLGLSSITKLNGYLLYLFFAIFIIWTKKRLNSFIDKRFLITFLTSILVNLPVWIYLYLRNANPLLHQLQAMTAKSGSAASIKSYGFLELIIRGFNNFIDLMIDGHSVATLSLPWYPILQLAAIYLCIITIFYYIHPFLKAQKSESFVFIFFMVFNIFVALYRKRHEYYLLWSIPIFFIMVSNISVRCFDYLKFQPKNIKFFISILTLVFVIIFIFSYIITGTMAPFVNKGVKAGYEEQVIKIKNYIQPGDAIAASLPTTVNYYLDKYDFKVQENNIQIFDLYYVDKKSLVKEVDIKMLEEVKPRFIITSEWYQSAYSDSYSNIIIRNNYNLISKEDGILLFERKFLSRSKDGTSNNKSQYKELYTKISSRIYSDIFSRSIPKYMTIGEPYQVFVFVKNTGQSTEYFLVKLIAPSEYIYPQQSIEIIKLDKGEFRRVKFPITPIKQHFGELNITAKLYLLKSNRNLPSSFIELDNTSTSIFWIKNAFSIEYIP